MSWDELTLLDEQAVEHKEYINVTELNRLYARVFNTDDGQKVLKHLRAITIEQPAFIPGEEASYGFCREGQNSLIREIEKRIARARG
jgi:hypothetical protein|tara:strand:+ start:2489 stop:2749 length:261 start_codon:yes stop_codon:yes gene_type:complete